MGKDYYKILGVDKSSSQDDIKKAFRKKAHSHHPDKAGGDEAKFKEANEAYQVLGNEKRRAQYDQYGSAFENTQSRGGYSGFEGFSGATTGGFNVNMDDIGDIFGGIGDIFGFGGGRQKARSRSGSDIQTVLMIEFFEAVFGAEKEVNLNKKVKCGHCNGNVAEPGTKIETCSTCKGSGRVMRVQRTVLGNMQMQAACEACGGEGMTYEKKCIECGGAGTARDTVKLKIKIPAGINDGETIRLTGQGEAGERGAPSGDLYITVSVRSDKRFNRDGSDIRSETEISFTQAAIGAKIDIETVGGSVKLKIPAGTQSGTIFKLRGRGISRLHSAGKGDHFTTISVKIPKSLTKKQKNILEEMGL